MLACVLLVGCLPGVLIDLEIDASTVLRNVLLTTELHGVTSQDIISLYEDVYFEAISTVQCSR